MRVKAKYVREWRDKTRKEYACTIDTLIGDIEMFDFEGDPVDGPPSVKEWVVLGGEVLKLCTRYYQTVVKDIDRLREIAHTFEGIEFEFN